MDHPQPCPAPGVSALERELRLVREAIGLVDSGAARRVVVAGLRLRDLVIGPAGMMARDRGLRVELLRPAGRERVDLVVERDPA